MLTLQKFKLQISTEFIFTFSFLLIVFIIFFLVYLSIEKDLENLRIFYENYNYCNELAKELNSLINLQSDLILEIDFKKKVKVQNFTIYLENVFCRTSVKEILFLNGSIAIL
ncbi:MAG: hypothetical protein QXQ14_03470, partial [Candidatus Aenigmatarchaeota archaeon]